MIRFKVRSLPLKEVIADIAGEMKVEYTKNCGIYQLRIPERIGSGVISGADFEDGLGLIQYDCAFLEDVIFEYSLDKVHPVKFIFCRIGSIAHKFSNESVWHDIPSFKNAIVASSAHNGHVVRFMAKQPTVYTSLELDRRRFLGKISCEPLTLDKSWRNMLNDVTAKTVFYHEGFYSLRLSEQFEEWDHFDKNDFLKVLHLEGLAYKILVFQIKQFQDDIKSEGKRTILRKIELNQMQKAIRIIEEKIDELPTIPEIATEVGLNPHSLQQGFKELFKITANEYITTKRLETARALLLNSDYSLAAISLSIGYKSVSYFSKIFRKRYGIRPSEFRKKGNKKNFLPKNLQRNQP